METRSAVPRMGRGVRTISLPLINSTAPSRMRRVRTLGPGRSCRMAIGFWHFLEAARTRRMVSVCSAKVPWEKFTRATSIPARMSRWIISLEWLAGPSVHTILARRRVWNFLLSSMIFSEGRIHRTGRG